MQILYSVPPLEVNCFVLIPGIWSFSSRIIGMCSALNKYRYHLETDFFFFDAFVKQIYAILLMEDSVLWNRCHMTLAVLAT